MSAVLQSITIISTLSPISAIGPLLFVLFVGIIREGYEDYVHFRKILVEKTYTRLINQPKNNDETGKRCFSIKKVGGNQSWRPHKSP